MLLFEDPFAVWQTAPGAQDSQITFSSVKGNVKKCHPSSYACFRFLHSGSSLPHVAVQDAQFLSYLNDQKMPILSRDN